MRVIFSYLRLSLFVLGVLAGVQVPHFVDQYGKALQSHYLEIEQNIQQFQQEADKYFNGDIQQLIAYYKASDDKVFVEGGESIDTIYQRYQRLRHKYQQFQQDSWSAYQQTFLSPVNSVRAEVRANYDYAIRLTPDAIAVALVIGFILAAISEIVLRLITWPFRMQRRVKPEASKKYSP